MPFLSLAVLLPGMAGLILKEHISSLPLVTLMHSCTCHSRRPAFRDIGTSLPCHSRRPASRDISTSLTCHSRRPASRDISTSLYVTTWRSGLRKIPWRHLFQLYCRLYLLPGHKSGQRVV